MTRNRYPSQKASRIWNEFQAGKARPMDLEDLLARVYAAGAHFTAEADALIYQGPKEVLTPEVRQAIGEHKTRLLAEMESASYLPEEKKLWVH